MSTRAVPNHLFDADIHRPTYHFLPPSGWMNDPNGPIYWHGVYHLFYQYNPYSSVNENKHWGHASSTDLVHWTHLPVALAPEQGGPDYGGVASGCAVDNNGIPTLVYTGFPARSWTGLRPEVQCIATGDKDLITWKKHPQNPVIAQPPAGMKITGFRDPCVWSENGIWYMIIGSGLEGTGGSALLYRSDDLVRWEYMHPLVTGNRTETGINWECPDFFPLGDRHVLVISPQVFRDGPRPRGSGVTYLIGRYSQHRFEPEHSGMLDAGLMYYAPKSFAGPNGRRIIWGWLREGRSTDAYVAAGWAGAQSVPRDMWLSESGDMRISPSPELKTLRKSNVHLQDVKLGPNMGNPLQSASGDCLEIAVEAERGKEEVLELRFRCSPDGREYTSLRYDWINGALLLDTNRSSLDHNSGVLRETITAGHSSWLQPAETRFKVGSGELLKLRVFLDRSTVEVFANDRACLTSRMYPTMTESIGLSLAAIGGETCIPTIDVWEMASIW